MLPRPPDASPEGARSDILDRDGVALVETGIPADRPDRAGARPGAVALVDAYFIPDERLEQVLAFLLDCAPHLLAAANLDPLRGIAVGDPDVTPGAITCTALGPLPHVDDLAAMRAPRPRCTRGLHPAAWDHLRGDGRDITDKWTGDYR